MKDIDQETEEIMEIERDLNRVTGADTEAVEKKVSELARQGIRKEKPKFEIVSKKRISECPSHRLDPKHYIGFKKCACFNTVDQELLNAMLSDKNKDFGAKLSQIKKILEDNPRISLLEISRKLRIPVSTIYDNMQKLFKLYDFKGILIKKKKGDLT